MKNEKQIKILKEIIEKEIDLILAERTGGGALESNPLYRTFIQPYFDFFSVVSAETSKLISTAWSSLNQFVAIGAIEFLALWNPELYGYGARSTIIGTDGEPIVITGNQAFQNLTGINWDNYLRLERAGLEAHIRRVDNDYEQVYSRINSNIGSGDATGILFLINPGLFAVAEVAKQGTGLALNTASTLTGRSVPEIENLNRSYARYLNTQGITTPTLAGGSGGGGYGGGYDSYDYGDYGDYGIQFEQNTNTNRPFTPQEIQQIRQTVESYKNRLKQILERPNIQRIINNQPGAIAAKEYVADGIVKNIIGPAGDDLIKNKSFLEFSSKQPTVAKRISDNIKDLIITRFEQQAANQQEQAANQQEQEESPAQSTGTASTSATTSTQSTSSTEEEPQQETQPIEVVMPTEQQLNRVIEEAFQKAREEQKKVYVEQLKAIVATSPELATTLNPKIQQILSI